MTTEAVARAQAREHGRETWTGQRCPKCGGAVRWTSSGRCVVCAPKKQPKAEPDPSDLLADELTPPWSPGSDS
jgi:hypothetical protein